MKENNSKKLTVNPWRIIKIFLLTFIVLEVIFYVTFQGVNGTFFPFDNSFYYYTPILFVATGVFCYISITQTFYEINGPTFIHSKMGKVMQYSFSDIIYIDEAFSMQKKMMRFFTRDGKEHILIFDKNAVLYETALRKCPLLSYEEFLRRFPNVKM